MKVFGVSKAALKAIELPVPHPKEQTAIASILSDMDVDIAAVEAKLAKASQLKRGMMQQLLTGRFTSYENFDGLGSHRQRSHGPARVSPWLCLEPRSGAGLF